VGCPPLAPPAFPREESSSAWLQGSDPRCSIWQELSEGSSARVDAHSTSCSSRQRRPRRCACQRRLAQAAASGQAAAPLPHHCCKSKRLPQPLANLTAGRRGSGLRRSSSLQEAQKSFTAVLRSGCCPGLLPRVCPEWVAGPMRCPDPVPLLTTMATVPMGRASELWTGREVAQLLQGAPGAGDRQQPGSHRCWAKAQTKAGQLLAWPV